MAKTEFTIKTNDLNKCFKNVKAVQGVNLAVRKGDVYGFLGPNGAGKTTTIKMILGLTHPDSGNVFINGKNTSKSGVDLRARIGYLPERAQLYKNLTAIQTLNFFAELRKADKKECDELLNKVGLTQWRDTKVGTFSKGMVQLLGISQALLGDPKLLILDEPTSGLDPRWSRILKDVILEKNSKGTTIFFSSHLLFEVQELCNRVAILNKGKLIIEDTVDKISEGVHLKPQLILTISGDTKAAVKILKKGGFDSQLVGDQIKVLVEPDQKAKVLNLLEDNGFVIQDFITKEPSLEKAFIEIIGDEAGVGGDINEA
ncbi:MAG: ABC transporter ATP-binding protein [Candidatus Bathyarchaeota archaeon]|jgi:ABC-type multidrug transport system ATPase subunit|nr:ABC transporter ATP-binding protein [Candidatus Bathyarchaeota archaeon]